jgi:hypothetical protein
MYYATDLFFIFIKNIIKIYNINNNIFSNLLIILLIILIIIKIIILIRQIIIFLL